MQQQDPLTPVLEPIHGAAPNLLAADVRPIVGGKIRAPGHDPMGGEIRFDGVGATEPWKAEKWRQGARITEGRAYRSNALIDFLLGGAHRKPREDQGVALAVRRNGVPFIID